MSATIRSTIATSLSAAGINPDSYASYIDVVANALEEREFTITETIVSGVSNQFGVPSEVVAAEVKAQTALEFRPIPEPVAVEVTVEETVEETITDEDGDSSEGATKSGGKAKRLAKLEKQLEELAASVKGLSDLAERHLGARR